MEIYCTVLHYVVAGTSTVDSTMIKLIYFALRSTVRTYNLEIYDEVRRKCASSLLVPQVVMEQIRAKGLHRCVSWSCFSFVPFLHFDLFGVFHQGKLLQAREPFWYSSTYFIVFWFYRKGWLFFQKMACQLNYDRHRIDGIECNWPISKNLITKQLYTSFESIHWAIVTFGRMCDRKRPSSCACVCSNSISYDFFRFNCPYLKESAHMCAVQFPINVLTCIASGSHGPTTNTCDGIRGDSLAHSSVTPIQWRTNTRTAYEYIFIVIFIFFHSVLACCVTLALFNCTLYIRVCQCKLRINKKHTLSFVTK